MTRCITNIIFVHQTVQLHRSTQYSNAEVPLKRHTPQNGCPSSKQGIVIFQFIVENFKLMHVQLNYSKLEVCFILNVYLATLGAKFSHRHSIIH